MPRLLQPDARSTPRPPPAPARGSSRGTARRRSRSRSSAGVADAAEPQGAVGEPVPVARHDRHDLAEAQRDDGQVVAAQPQGRRAEQHAEDRADDRGHRQHEPERDVEMHGVRLAGDHEPAHLPEPLERLPEARPLGLELAGGGDAVAVGADGEERGVAEVEQPGEADHDVEPERQHGVGERVGRRVHVAGVAAEDREQQRRDRAARGVRICRRREIGSARQRSIPRRAPSRRSSSAVMPSAARARRAGRSGGRPARGQDREDDHVGPRHAEELAAEGLDQPDQRPPSIAPGMLPMPPSTAAVKARSPAV